MIAAAILLLTCAHVGHSASNKHGELPPTFLGFLPGSRHRPPRTHALPNHSTAVSMTDLVDEATLQAGPTPFIDSGADITVTWNKIPAPEQRDWIGVYCGKESGVSATNVLDWMYVPLVNESGSALFRNLINMRCNYFFRYYRDLPDGSYGLIAESNDVEPLGGFNIPMHGRLSLTGKVDEMQVTWTSGSVAQGQQGVRFSRDCTVKHGPTEGIWDGEVHNTTAPTTYEAADMCQAPATTVGQATFRPVGFFHTVTLTSLQPLTEYCYQYGNDVDGWSPIERFYSSKPPGAEEAVTLIAYGDMGVGQSPAATSTLLRVAAEIETVDLLLHFGDISYSRGYGYIWEQFFSLIEPVSSKIPYMISIGNHEYDHMAGGENDPSGADGQGFHPSWGNYGSDSGGECGVPMVHRFHTPSNGLGLFWYSFQFGNIHIVQFSSEHDFTEGSEQRAWLEADLHAVDRTVTPFVIVTAHRPMYNSEDYKSDYEVSLHLRSAIEPLLDTYSVDVFLAGHYHSYERTCRVLHERCMDISPPSPSQQLQRGTVHVTIGSAGASLDGAEWYDVDWHAFGSYEFGYLRVISTRNTMTLEYVHNSDGSISDMVEITAQF